METTTQFIHMDGHQCSTSPPVLHLPSIKLHSLKLSDFLDIGFDDSFSEILLPHIEDDLDSLTEVFNPVRDGPSDLLDDTTQCSSNFTTSPESQETHSTASSPDVFNSSQKLVPCSLDFSDISSSPDSKDVLSQALEFSDLTCLDANSEEQSFEEQQPSAEDSPSLTEEPRVFSDCCFAKADSDSSSYPPCAVNIMDYEEDLSTCRFSVSLSDLVNEPCPVSAAFCHITEPSPECFPVTESNHPHINTLLFQREQDIRRRFQTLHMDHPQDVQQLSEFYMYQMATIETERLNTTKPPCLPDHALALNQHYDHQLNQVMDRVEQSIRLLEDARNQPIRPIRPIRKQRASFPKKAILIMEDWYEKNVSHPYPDSITVELIAIQGGITGEQVKKWFGNKRNRSNNTRTLTEIAKKKRQIAHNCFSDLSL